MLLRPGIYKIGVCVWDMGGAVAIEDIATAMADVRSNNMVL